MNVSQAVESIDCWFKKMADDEWEHHNGITIESSDNPGWILSIDLPESSSGQGSEIAEIIKNRPNVEGGLVEGKLRIYSSELSAVVETAGVILKDH